MLQVKVLFGVVAAVIAFMAAVMVIQGHLSNLWSLLGVAAFFFIVFGAMAAHQARFSLAGARGSSQLQLPSADVPTATLRETIRAACVSLGREPEAWEEGRTFCVGEELGDHTLLFVTRNIASKSRGPESPRRIAVISRGESQLDFHRRIKGVLLTMSEHAPKAEQGPSRPPEGAHPADQPIPRARAV
jgi:hypothetical protein